MPHVYYNAQIQHEGNGNKPTMRHTGAIARETSDVPTDNQHIEGPYEQMVSSVTQPRETETPQYAKLK